MSALYKNVKEYGISLDSHQTMLDYLEANLDRYRGYTDELITDMEAIEPKVATNTNNITDLRNTKARYEVPIESRTGYTITSTVAENHGVAEMTRITGGVSQAISTQGKNICPTSFSEWESGGYSTTTGLKEVLVTRVRVKRLIKVSPSTAYYFNTYSTAPNSNIIFVVRTYDSSGVFVRSVGGITMDVAGNVFTTGSTENYISLQLYDSTNVVNSFAQFSTYFNSGALKPFICLNSEVTKTYVAFVPDMPSPDYSSLLQHLRTLI